METPYEITDKNQFEDLINNSRLSKKEIVILKYSTQCYISSEVENLFDDWVKSLDESSKLVAAKVNVISSKMISLNIAQALGVKHQSPQIIWLDKKNKVKWTASHYDISIKELNYYYSELIGEK